MNAILVWATAAWLGQAGPAEHWAYRTPVRPTPPRVANDAAVRNPIDRFVVARLEKEGLAPAPEAERARLLRRVSLDLVGLPPTPEQVARFLADESPEAYERAVDALLASPRYGERWATPWLDLARYADSNGFQRDGFRAVWPYRDYVVDAFNRDLPYDQFVREQIAGDLIPNATLAQKIATGFQRCTTVNVEAGVDREEDRINAVFDRVNVTGAVFLGATLVCAQCHDHKSDPWTMADYYRFLAFFNNTPIETLETGKGQERQFAGPSLELTKDGKDGKPHATGELKSLVMVEMETPRKTAILKRGNFLRPGAKVSADVPAQLGKLPTDARRDRLGLAEWLTRPDHPLTARVAVNRWWAEFFGVGLVSTPEDFGLAGERPSHPELLDWLATELVARGWSMKATHRLIVTSATYRQASRVTPALLQRDPQNRLLARGPRQRLGAEAIRDQALAVSGLLVEKVGGPPVFPPQPEGVWNVTGAVDNTYKASEGPDRYRRGLYTVWRRSSPYPSFVAFDAPERTACVVARPRTNTPLQALTLLNDPVYVEAAAHLANRVLREAPGTSTRERLDFAVRLVLARPAREDEREILESTLERRIARYRDDAAATKSVLAPAPAPAGVAPAEAAAWRHVASILLNLDETLVKH